MLHDCLCLLLEVINHHIFVLGCHLKINDEFTSRGLQDNVSHCMSLTKNMLKEYNAEQDIYIVCSSEKDWPHSKGIFKLQTYLIFLQIIQSKIRKDQQNLCMHFRTNSLNGCTTFKHSVFSTNTCKSSAISITACKPTGLFNRDCEPTHKLKKSVRRPKPLSVI